mmetsp:Transcript_28942/g.59723  ORF Transcript_28942/g.59723 Transcript_28942/m.59723 type:complete len:226 (+) Transcript_28942:30-707(+)
MSPVPSMERSLVRLIGRPGDVPVAKHVLARAEARHLQQLSDPLMCQEQTAIAQTFNEERFQEWEDRLKHERAKAKVEQQKQIIIAADIAQAVVFADEAPFLFRLQEVMGRTSRGSSRSRSRGGDNKSTSDGDSEAESYSVSDSSQEPASMLCVEETAEKASAELSGHDKAPDESARQEALQAHLRWLEESRAKLQEKLKAHTEQELAEKDPPMEDGPPDIRPVYI